MVVTPSTGAIAGAGNVPVTGTIAQTNTGLRSTTNNTVTVDGTAATSNQATNTDQLLILNNFPGTNFLVLAASGSLLEVSIGEIAQTNSSNSEIQQFGQRLVTDHSKSYNDAKALADSMGIALRPLDDQEQSVVQRFESLSGDAFDRTFTRFLIQDHIQDIGRFEIAAERASNRDVRAYAATNLPVLLGHLTTLLNIRETLLGNQPLTQ
jgi:putative membrane protein